MFTKFFNKKYYATLVIVFLFSVGGLVIYNGNYKNLLFNIRRINDINSSGDIDKLEKILLQDKKSKEDFSTVEFIAVLNNAEVPAVLEYDNKKIKLPAKLRLSCGNFFNADIKYAFDGMTYRTKVNIQIVNKGNDRRIFVLKKEPYSGYGPKDIICQNFGKDGVVVTSEKELNRAINVAKDGDVIYLKNGKYTLRNSPLRELKKKIILKGESTHGTILGEIGESQYIVFRMFAPLTIENCSILGGTLINVTDKLTVRNSILISGSKYIGIDNQVSALGIGEQNFPNSELIMEYCLVRGQIFSFDKVKLITINNSAILSVGAERSALNIHSAERLMVAQTVLLGEKTCIDTSASSVFLSNVRFEQAQTGIYARNSRIQLDNCIFQNCTRLIENLDSQISEINTKEIR